MPEEVCPLRSPPGEAGAVHDVGDPPNDGIDEGWHINRVVFHVGVLNHGDIAIDKRDGRLDSSALSTVCLSNHDIACSPDLPTLEHRWRAIRRSVVDYNHLLVKRKGVQ